MSPVDTVRKRARRVIQDLGLSPDEHPELQTLLESALMMDLSHREQDLKEMICRATVNEKIRLQELQAAIKDEFDF